MYSDLALPKIFKERSEYSADSPLVLMEEEEKVPGEVLEQEVQPQAPQPRPLVRDPEYFMQEFVQPAAQMDFNNSVIIKSPEDGMSNESDDPQDDLGAQGWRFIGF